MRNVIAAVTFAAALLLLAGCMTVVDAPVGTYKVGRGHQVSLGRHWADVSAIMLDRSHGVHVLSVDGPLLNRLYLSEGLGAGDSLVKSTVKEKPTPTYKTDFSPTETVEFVADSVAALGYQKVETSHLRPGRFGNEDGLRFDLVAKTTDGLDVSGSAMIAQKGGRLYVILFLAPTEHFFGDAAPEIDAIMNSVQFHGV